VDDSFLQRAASSIPKDAIFLIEDIDCAFASRSDEDHREELYGPLGHPIGPHGARSLVTLSGLLNVIDGGGFGSDEGRLFFATTNHIDRLDPALLRPGRIDLKVAYGLATRDQVHSLFMHFFPESRFLSNEANATTLEAVIGNLATNFSLGIPPAEFSTAELQHYLQGHKTMPMAAVDGVPAWVAEQQMERNTREREREEADRRMRQRPQEMQQTACAGPLTRMQALCFDTIIQKALMFVSKVMDGGDLFCRNVDWRNIGHIRHDVLR
ncbi:hypothetical protein B0H13DRAFT_1588296, partial [Mycena leptocephala]